MDRRQTLRTAVGIPVALLCAAALLLGVRRGLEPARLALVAAYGGFFALGAIPRVWTVVPRFKRYGLLAVGLVALGGFLAGAADDLVIGSTLVGLASLADVAWYRYRERTRAP